MQPLPTSTRLHAIDLQQQHDNGQQVGEVTCQPEDLFVQAASGYRGQHRMERTATCQQERAQLDLCKRNIGY